MPLPPPPLADLAKLQEQVTPKKTPAYSDISREFYERSGGCWLRCPLCDGEDFHKCEPGVNISRIICKRCGHTLWFATDKAMEEIRNGPSIPK
jgi:hypothetical protein